MFAMQFYVFDSGLPQPSHFLLAFFFALSVLYSSGRFDVKGNKFIFGCGLFFVCYTIVLNSFFTFLHQDPSFLRASIYYVYGFIAFIILGLELRQRKSARYALSASCVLGLTFLVVAYTIGMGRYDFSPRYNGYFNDPNQMAFWALCCYSLYCLLVDNNLSRMLLAIPLVFLILVSMSRSGLLGLVFVGLGLSLNFLSLNKKNLIRTVYFVVIITISIGCLLYLSESGVVDELISSVFNRFADSDFEEQADIRGYGRIFKYGEYLLFGAGQGMDFRFESTNEIHSTWVGLLFYYGAIGCSSFLLFIFLLLRSLSFDKILFSMAPLIYGFSTFGMRTPIFWILFSAMLVAKADSDKAKSSLVYL